MANNYLWTSFNISPSAEDREFLMECVQIAQDLGGWGAEVDWETTSNRFKATFPKAEGDDPFETFALAIADDPEFCSPDAEFIDEGDQVWVSGECISPWTIANLIQKCCPSALPFGFEWAYTCDKMRVGEFGGGYFLITPDKIEGGSTGWLLEEALGKLRNGSGNA